MVLIPEALICMLYTPVVKDGGLRHVPELHKRVKVESGRLVKATSIHPTYIELIKKFKVGNSIILRPTYLT